MKMKTYIVGGAVRDILMGIAPKDIDYVVVGSTPEEMLAQGFEQVGADFPVFLHPETKEEYALARTERKTGPGYNGFETRFAPDTTLEEDLARRDLTINAMAMGLDEAIIDPFGGRYDLERNILRHVSEAFQEDPVRILRIARFRARLGRNWTIAPETIKLCKEMILRGDLNDLTKERVLKEMTKALEEANPGLFFSTLQQLGAMRTLFPEMGGAAGFIDGKTPRERYSYIATSKEMDDRLGVSNDWKAYAAIQRALNAWRGNDIVEFFYSIGAYRNQTLAHEFFLDRGLTGWVAALNKTAAIGFDQLSEEQQATLSGPEIGKAIKALRKRAIL